MSAENQPATKAPTAAAKSSDGSGEQSTGLRNGIALGKKDATGDNKTFNTGRTEGTCYTHKRG